MYKIRCQSNYTLTQFNIVSTTKTAAYWNNAVTANDKGEYTMQQVDTLQQAPKVSTIFDRVIHFFGNSRLSTPLPDQVQSNIDWSDSDPEYDPNHPYHGSYQQPTSGGYNEAFIVQNWTSYHLR